MTSQVLMFCDTDRHSAWCLALEMTINRIDLNFGKYAFLLQITLENMQKCTYKPLENMYHTS